MKRKLIALLLSVITMISICTSAIPAFANSVQSVSKNGVSYFKKEWEYTITYTLKNNKKTNIGKLVFGYDTDYYNEDYAWSMGTVF